MILVKELSRIDRNGMIISLERIDAQVLHSLVEKITCTHEGEIHIQYSFANPLQVASNETTNIY